MASFMASQYESSSGESAQPSPYPLEDVHARLSFGGISMQTQRKIDFQGFEPRFDRKRRSCA
jgi:hypothetical protein